MHTSRIRSLDLVRGAACVLMAIDHVRVYSGLPAGGPSPAIFFTRWITHFVAPTFCLLAGTGAYLLGRRLNDSRALAKFLATRGLLLVVLELTVIRFLWSFNPNLSAFSLAGVIWMLGWCMLLLAACVRLPARIVGLSGVAIVLLQQLFSLVPRVLPEPARTGFNAVWAFIYPSGSDALFGVNVLYVLVPWIGVMMAGYGFGVIMARDDDTRRRTVLRIGLGMTGAFFLFATALTIATRGRGTDGDIAPFWMQMLNQQKYPASQLFLLMTLGPMITLLAAVDGARGWWSRALVTFGRVPMFYYLAHILVIHVAALLVNVIRTGSAHGEWYLTAPYTSVPADQRWSLGLLYLVVAIVVAGVLYPACQWYAGVKARHPGGWMQYL